MATKVEVDALLRLKDGVSKNAAKASASVGKLNKSVTGAKTGFRGLGSSLSSTATQLTGMSPAMLGVGGAATVLVGGILAATKQTIALGTQLKDLQSQTGLSVQAIQELKFAGEQAGVGLEQVTNAVLKLGRRVASGLPDAQKGLERLGLATDDILSRNPEEAFKLVAEQLQAMGPGAHQAAAAMEVFGMSGLQILPAINQGIAGNIERFRELDVAMSEEAAGAAKRLGDSLTDLNAQWTAVKTGIGNLVIPALTNIIIFFTDLVPAAIQHTMSFVAKFIAEYIHGIGMIAAAGAFFSDTFADISDGIFQLELDVRGWADAQTEAGDANLKAAVAALMARDSQEAAAAAAVEHGSALTQALIPALEATSVLASPGGLPTKLDDVAAAQLRAAMAAHEHEIMLAKAENQAKDLGITGESAIKPITLESENASVGVAGLGGAIGNAQGLMGTFGIESDSTFGKILGWADQALSAFDSILGLIGNLTSGLGGLGGILGKLFGGGGGNGGGGLGALLGGLGGGGIAGLAIGGIGAAVAGIASLFGGGGPEDVQADVQRDQGQSISETLAKQIDDSGKHTQLFIADIFGQQSNVDPGRLLTEMGDLFSGVEQGLFSEGEANAALESALPLLLENLDALSASDQAMLDRLLGATDTFGFGEGVADAIRDALTESPAAPPASTPSASGGGTAGGGGNKPAVVINVTLETGVISANAGELAQAIADATGTVVRENLGGVVGAIETQLEGTFERQG